MIFAAIKKLLRRDPSGGGGAASPPKPPPPNPPISSPTPVISPSPAWWSQRTSSRFSTFRHRLYCSVPVSANILLLPPERLAVLPSHVVSVQAYSARPCTLSLVEICSEA